MSVNVQCRFSTQDLKLSLCCLTGCFFQISVSENKLPLLGTWTRWTSRNLFALYSLYSYVHSTVGYIYIIFFLLLPWHAATVWPFRTKEQNILNIIAKRKGRIAPENGWFMGCSVFFQPSRFAVSFFPRVLIWPDEQITEWEVGFFVFCQSGSSDCASYPGMMMHLKKTSRVCCRRSWTTAAEKTTAKFFCHKMKRLHLHWSSARSPGCFWWRGRSNQLQRGAVSIWLSIQTSAVLLVLPVEPEPVGTSFHLMPAATADMSQPCGKLRCTAELKLSSVCAGWELKKKKKEKKNLAGCLFFSFPFFPPPFLLPALSLHLFSESQQPLPVWPDFQEVDELAGCETGWKDFCLLPGWMKRLDGWIH